jgi:phosphoribosylamine--glycine ligase / phosphoribosylformylglycinamidine cyclo-ligase
LSYDSPCPWETGSSLGVVLLKPTLIYVSQILKVLKHDRSIIKAMSHITGGGLPENVPRMLSHRKDLGTVIDVSSWKLSEMFKWLKKAGGDIEPIEMAKTWNCGIGMILIVGKDRVDEVIGLLRPEDCEFEVIKVGEVVQGSGIELKNLDSWR